MGKKSKSKKSKAKQAKAETNATSETVHESASPLWHDVYTLVKTMDEVTLARIENLLKAVNEVTLKRLEERNDIFERNVTQFMSDTREKLGTLIATVNALDTTLVWDLLPRMDRATHAIKAKTDRLP